MDLLDPKELRDQLVPRGLRESPERLVQWDFMEKEVKYLLRFPLHIGDCYLISLLTAINSDK